VDEVAPARTYGFLRDVGAMRRNGLARGGSLDNAIVVGKRSVLNDSLRFANEFVRHKILDLVGDLFLLGRPLVGHVVARNAGHALNYQILVAIQKAMTADRRRARMRAVTPLATVLAEPTRFADQVVKTEGEITRVCQSMGCWMELRAEVGGQAVHVPMAGHAFFLPRDVAGKRATIEGRVSVQERSPEQVAHLQAEGSEVAALALSIEAAGVEVR